MTFYCSKSSDIIVKQVEDLISELTMFQHMVEGLCKQSLFNRNELIYDCAITFLCHNRVDVLLLVLLGNSVADKDCGRLE